MASRTREATLRSCFVRFRLQLAHLLGGGGKREAGIKHPGSIAPPLGGIIFHGP